MNESFAGDEFIRKVIATYSDTIYRVSYQYVRNRADAEDVLQDVFLALLDALHRNDFESDEHMKAWLIRVAINKSINVAKSNARRRKKEAAEEFAQPDSQYLDLESVLQKLPSEDREIVYLHYYEGYSAGEIAEMIGKNETAVFKRLSRSRKKLKSYLEGGETL